MEDYGSFFLKGHTKNWPRVSTQKKIWSHRYEQTFELSKNEISIKIWRLVMRVQTASKNEANCCEANTNLVCSKFNSM